MIFTEDFGGKKKTITIEFEDNDNYLELKMARTGIDFLKLILTLSRTQREKIEDLENIIEDLETNIEDLTN